MRKALKESLLKDLTTIYKAHNKIKGYAGKQAYENIQALLLACKNVALQMKSVIKESEGEDCKVIAMLEEYSNAVDGALQNNLENCKSIKETLDEKLENVENVIRQDIPVKLEIVFMPYKASMWDSLESVWKAADEDESCDAYVVPMPYFDRLPDQSMGERHYEGEMFPGYVPIIHYNLYDFAERKPDVIYIHNPYDEYNLVTSVDPRFYSSELKKYTECLVYIPYYVLGHMGKLENFARSAGVINADYVITQNEEFNKKYMYYADAKQTKKEKFLPLGSPKYDKILRLDEKNVILLPEWKELLYDENGNKKNVVLYNTTVSGVLYSDNYIKKIKSVINVFRGQKDVVLWWRPHPLLENTLKSMRPHLYKEYRTLVDDYKTFKSGIYDDTSDMYPALAMADAYYGDGSSLVPLCRAKGMLVMAQNIEMCEYKNKYQALVFNSYHRIDKKIYFAVDNYNALLCYDMETEKTTKVAVFEREPLYQQDLFTTSILWKNKIVFVPNTSKNIYIYDLSDKTMQYVPLENAGVSPAFACAVKKDNLIYLFPHYYPALVTVNMDTCKVQNVYDFTQKGIAPYCAFQSVTVGEKSYVPCMSENKVAVLDLKKAFLEFKNIGNNEISFAGIAADKKNLYLSLNKKNGIMKWELSSNTVEFLENSLERTYANLYVKDSILTAVTTVMQDVYVYDLKSKEMTLKKLDYNKGIRSYLTEIRFFGEDGKVYSTNRDGCFHNAMDDSVVIKPEYDAGLLKELVYETVMDKKELPLYGTIYEQDMYTIESLVDLLAFISKKGLKVSYYGNEYKVCGKTIHETIKEML